MISQLRASILLLLLLAAMAAAPGSAVARPQVLVLHSSYRGYPWTDTQEQGILDVLAHSGLHPQVQIEYLDLYRNLGAAYHADLRRLIAAKVGSRHYDVIICTDDPALDFVLDDHATLFHNAPTTFCGINNFQDAKLRGEQGFTGVSEIIDIKDTLDAMLLLHPDLQHVAVIGDKQPYYYANRAQLYQVMPAYRHRLQFQFIEGLPLERLGKPLSSLPPHTAVLLLCHLWNAQREVLSPGPATQQLTTICPLPIYTCWDFFLDHGTVGGKVISGYSQGMTAAEMAVRILRGAPVSAVPIKYTAPSQYTFDYLALRRFGLSAAHLPPGSVLLHRPNNWYRVKKGVLWGGVALLIVLLGIVLMLLVTVLQRLRAEEALRRANRTLAALIDTAPVAIVSTDTDGRVTKWNPAAEALFGWPEAAVLGSLPPFLAAVDPEESTARRTALYQGQVLHDVEVPLIRRDGRPIDVRMYAAPIDNGRGRYLGVVLLFADVTERKQIEAQERQISLMAERERMQTEFLSSLSHELKTPLTPIQSGLELLEDEHELSPEQRRLMLATMRHQVQRLLYLINDLLSLAQIESGQLTLEKAAVYLPAIIRQSLTAFRTSSSEPEISYQYEEVTPAPMIRADARRLEQVLDNLITNARKYMGTQPGRITVRTSLQGERMRIEVEDTGIGIAAEDLERIFSRFIQVNPFHPGAGLGLAIVKHLVEAHGGGIWAESPGPGCGSSFIVELPGVIHDA